MNEKVNTKSAKNNQTKKKKKSFVFCPRNNILLLSLSQALIDLIAAVDWHSFTIVYENNDSLMQITNILKSPPTNNPIRIRQLGPGPSFR